MDLNEIAVFVKVVEAGSFAGAAQQLKMPKSTVSSKVSTLEKRLGVTLIRRTTRRLFITDVGNEYFQHCQQALRHLTAAEDQVTERQAVPQGRLRITAPVELGASLLPRAISEFQKRYPEVHLEILLTDRTVDLVADGVDLAIRAGDLKDSTLVASKIGSVYFAPFASPKYLKANGTPKHPKDLRHHCCIQFAPLGDWKLGGPKGSLEISAPRNMVINDLNLIKSLVASGVGIALLPTFLCYAEAKDGRFVRILEDWRSNLRPVHFVYPHQEFVPKKLSAFLAIARELAKESLETFAI